MSMVAEQVVGREDDPFSKDVPHVIDLVAVGVITIQSVCHSAGVPERLVVNDVISTANAVMLNLRVTSVLIVGVALDVMVSPIVSSSAAISA